MKTSVKWPSTASTASTVDVQTSTRRAVENVSGRRRPVENVSGRRRPVVKAQSGRRRPVVKAQSGRRRQEENLSGRRQPQFSTGRPSTVGVSVLTFSSRPFIVEIECLLQKL